MPYFCQAFWIKAQSVDFAHILSVSFQIKYCGVQRTNAKKSIIIPLFMKLIVTIEENNSML